MHDAGPVRVVEPAQDLADDRQRALARQRPLIDHRRQRVAGQELHGQEQRAVGRAPEVGDGDDVGVREAARRLGLALEAARELLAAAELGQQHLDREIAPHHRVLGAIDRAHAAHADAAHDAVALADDRADQRIDHGRAAARTERVLDLDLERAAGAGGHGRLLRARSSAPLLSSARRPRWPWARSCRRARRFATRRIVVGRPHDRHHLVPRVDELARHALHVGRRDAVRPPSP